MRERGAAEGSLHQTRGARRGLGGAPVDAGLVPWAGSGWNPRAVPYDRVAPVRHILGGRRVRKEAEKEGQNVCIINPGCAPAAKITLAQRLSRVFRGIEKVQCGGVCVSRGDRQDCGGTTRSAAALGPGLGGKFSVRDVEYGGRGSGSGQVLPAPPLWLTGSTWRTHMHTVPFCPARAVWGRCARGAGARNVWLLLFGVLEYSPKTPPGVATATPQMAAEEGEVLK